jgi:hypothetical protein
METWNVEKLKHCVNKVINHIFLRSVESRSTHYSNIP